MNAPAEYVASGASQRNDAAHWIKEFRDEIKAMHGTVMDIGCGPGDTTRNGLLPHLPNDTVVVGIDRSPEMIKYAEEHNNDEKRLSFFQLNIETTELPMNLIGKFDHLVSFDCLHWCKELKTVYHNIYKLLRPGGTALLICTSNHIAFGIYLEHQNNPKYSAYMQDMPNYIPLHYGLPNPENLMKDDLEKAEFKVLHCYRKWINYAFKNVECLLDLLMSASPFFNRMPDDIKKEYRDDVKKEILKIRSINKRDDKLNHCHYVNRDEKIVAYIKKSGYNGALDGRE